MSYDGGLIVKIKNKKLGEVLDEFNEKGYFPEGSVPRWRDMPEENDWGEVINPDVIYTLFYSYMDCAYVEGCPKNTTELGKFIAQLIQVYEEETLSYDKLKEIQNRLEQDDVVKDYEFVSWKYYQPGSGDLKDFQFKNDGKDV